MKKSLTIIALLVISVLANSCGSHTENNHEHSKTEPTTEPTTEHSHDEDSSLSLDHGKLWSANPETTTGIHNMIKLMNSFSDHESIEAHHTLKDSLNVEFGLIIKNCTMKGKPHDQLHLYLVPMKDLFEGLGSSDINVCTTSYDKLSKHLAEYSTYFE
ncbi:MAG: hypothetical protein OEX02_14150 [Cyclobacteriaceae bacterium]|nr:hypothetical protein [Cyclobacteriaceae bacterium]